MFDKQVAAVADAKERRDTQENRFRDCILAFVMLIVLVCVQAWLQIDGIVTFLVGTLAGAIAAYFGLGHL
ncbi:MAG: hypothetical protein ACYS30_25335, partial [Planctomycetota bacterium]